MSANRLPSNSSADSPGCARPAHSCEHEPHSAAFPAIVILWAVGLMLGALFLTQMYQNRELYSLNKRAWGNDYRFFYNGARLLMMDRSPYLERYFTSPPPAALLNCPLAQLPFGAAYSAFFGITLGCMAAALAALAAFQFPKQRAVSSAIFVSTFTALLLGFPFQFLIERGNTDAVVVALSAFGLLALRKREGLAGSLIGLAAAIKIYPLLLFLPLLVFRKFRTAIAGVITIGVLAALTWEHWPAFFHQFAARDSVVRFDENGSMANNVFYLSLLIDPDGQLLGVKTITRIGTLLFAALVGGMLLADMRRRHPADAKETVAHLLLYSPLMVSFPNLVYSYELVFAMAAVPAICHFWHTARTRDSRPFLVLMMAGAAMSQFQAVAFQKLTGVVAAHFVPSLGLLLMSLGALGFKAVTRARQEAEAPESAALPPQAAAAATA
jgi:glycosyl transferase family 87